MRQQPACCDRKGRDEDIGREINDEVERVAGPARQQLFHLECPRHRSVEAIHHQCHAEAKEHPGPMAACRQDQRQQGERRARGGEDVDRESADAREVRHSLPQFNFTISADFPVKFQLRP